MRSIFFVMIIGLVGCKTQPSEQKQLISSIERSRCLGTCPSYKFELFSDLTARYEGNENVEVRGVREIKLSEENYERYIALFKESNFFTLDDDYYEEVTDLQTTILYYKEGKSEKKIRDYYGAPKSLKVLEEKVQDLIFDIIKGSKLERVPNKN